MKKDNENIQETKAINYEPLLCVVLIRLHLKQWSIQKRWGRKLFKGRYYLTIAPMISGTFWIDYKLNTSLGSQSLEENYT